MEIKEGYVYHIKNDYFELVNDDKLMKNHEGNSTRPNYFCVKINNENKIKKYKKCDTIIIGNYRGKNHAFLIQNMFPITSKYIDHIDTVQGKALQVPSETRRIILDKVNKIFKLKKKGINLIFPDVDRIEKLLIEELNQK